MRCRIAVLCTIIVLFGGCREGDGPADPSAVDARIFLSSSPNGATITVDNRGTGRITPDTVALRRGDRVIALELESGGFTYDYRAIVEVSRSDSIIAVTLPVGLQCGSQDAACITGARRQYAAAGLRFAASAVGSVFYWGGSGGGILWPATSSDSYASSGLPVVAGLANGTPVALGLYDQTMFAGRPAPDVTGTGGAFLLNQQAWIVPPRDPLIRATTVRGILVEEEVIAHSDVDGTLVIRLTFRNVSDEPLVHVFAPHIPQSSVTYTNTWIGFALDADIGAASDDWLSYDPELDMVFAYDSNFSEAQFTGAGSEAPGLVGLRVLQAPAGTTVLLNSWSIGGDWAAGRQSEPAGYGMLTGSAIYAPDHAHPQIGYMPPDSRDVRLSVTAGPLTLAPGDEAEIVIAVAVAAPAAGTFTSGSALSPGDPFDTNRALYAVAANLRARMIAAGELLSIQ